MLYYPISSCYFMHPHAQVHNQEVLPQLDGPVLRLEQKQGGVHHRAQ